MSNEKQIKKNIKAVNAEKDYILGMNIKDIASKYSVKESTVRTWKYRYKWNETNETRETTVSAKTICISGMTLIQIRENLIEQLRLLGKENIQNIIEVDAYIDSLKEYIECKNDLEERGCVVPWENGEQSGFKKNESADLKLKISAERRKIITHLGLDSVIKVKDREEDEAL